MSGMDLELCKGCMFAEEPHADWCLVQELRRDEPFTGLLEPVLDALRLDLGKLDGDFSRVETAIADAQAVANRAADTIESQNTELRLLRELEAAARRLSNVCESVTDRPTVPCGTCAECCVAACLEALEAHRKEKG